MTASPSTSPTWLGAITRALVNHRADAAKAGEVLDELEAVALRTADTKVKNLAVIAMTTGFRLADPSADERSGSVARRLERIYRTNQDPEVKRAVLSAVGTLGGTGRNHALTWLDSLVVLPTAAHVFRNEALEAMRVLSRIEPAGRPLIIRLRDQGLIVDEEARFWANFYGRENRLSGLLPYLGDLSGTVGSIVWANGRRSRSPEPGRDESKSFRGGDKRP